MSISVRPTRLPSGSYVFAYTDDYGVGYYSSKRPGEREIRITREEYEQLLATVKHH